MQEPTQTSPNGLKPAFLKQEELLEKFGTIAVPRNGQTPEFQPVQIKRGDDAGKVYHAPVITKDNLLSTWLPWFGIPKVAELLQRTVNQMSITAFRQASSAGEDANGKDIPKPFDSEEFVKYMSSLSFAGDSIPVLKRRRMDLLDKLDELSPKMTNEDGTPNMEVFAEISALTVDIKNLGLEIKSRERKKEENEDAEPAIAVRS